MDPLRAKVGDAGYVKKMTGRRQTKYKRLSQRCVNNKKGVSLVGVIVAFLLLMIIMLMFQKSLKVSGNLIARSVDIRKEEQELIGDYYKNRTSPTNTESVSCVFCWRRRQLYIKY